MSGCRSSRARIAVKSCGHACQLLCPIFQAIYMTIDRSCRYFSRRCVAFARRVSGSPRELCTVNSQGPRESGPLFEGEAEMWPRLVAAFGGVTVAVLAASPAPAQTYPDRPVRIIIAFAAGGTIDTLGRIVAQKLGDAWGQSVFVENRPGAGGNIGAQAAAQSAPDGSTLHLG